jgi:hypothetical protein
MTSSPLAFTQGLHRVRNLADKTIHLYIEHESNNLPQTASDLTKISSHIYGYSDMTNVG